MDLFKKIVASMGPILNVVNPQNKIIQNRNSNQFGSNTIVALLIGIGCGFALCIVLMNQNIITITKVSEPLLANHLPVNNLQAKSGKP